MLKLLPTLNAHTAKYRDLQNSEATQQWLPHYYCLIELFSVNIVE